MTHWDDATDNYTACGADPSTVGDYEVTDDIALVTCPPCREMIAAELESRAEDAIEDGQARWAETGSTRKR